MKVRSFPGANGFGGWATGARTTGNRANPTSAEIILVTNNNNSGTGSLRSAATAAGPKYIVPVVGGLISGESQLEFQNNNFTYLGQTAPSPLIFSRSQVRIYQRENFVIRGLAVRVGDDVSTTDPDGINLLECTRGIFDHCQSMWSIDECASFRRFREGTVQWCAFSEPLNDSVHTEGFPHPFMSIVNGKNLSWHHNLQYSALNRNIRTAVAGADVYVPEWNGIIDFRNNLVMNYRTAIEGDTHQLNIIDNYFDPSWYGRDLLDKGDSSLPSVRIAAFANYIEQIYLSGNVLAINDLITKNNHLGYYIDNFLAIANQIRETPYPIPADTYSFSENAYQSRNLILKHAGMRLYTDDYHEKRIFDAAGGKKSLRGGRFGLIDSPNQVGGQQTIFRNQLRDYDIDGISISWKEKHGLDVGVNVGNDYDLDPFYPNIEVYANSLVSGKWDINFDGRRVFPEAIV